MFFKPDGKSAGSGSLNNPQRGQLKDSSTVQANRPLYDSFQPGSDTRPLMKRSVYQNPMAAEIDRFAAALDGIGTAKRAESNLELDRLADLNSALGFLCHDASIVSNRRVRYPPSV